MFTAGLFMREGGWLEDAAIFFRNLNTEENALSGLEMVGSV